MINFESLPKNNGKSSLQAVANSIGLRQNRSQLLPGRFFSFKIQSPSPILSPEVILKYTGGKSYLDLNPTGLVLFHENWKETLLVLNLKAIPPAVAQKLLQAYWYFSGPNGLYELFKEDTLIDLEERRLIDKRFYLITPTILRQLIGLNNINLAINKYNIDDIMEARLIDWDQFGELINPIPSTFGMFPEGISLESLYSDFITNAIN